MAGLYIHIPFCGSRCAYCDFYSTTSPERIAEYVEALKREMTARSLLSTFNFPLSTIYIGGGTPSLLPPERLQELLDHAAGLWDCSGVREITLEANPEDLTDEYLARLANHPGALRHPSTGGEPANTQSRRRRESVGFPSFGGGVACSREADRGAESAEHCSATDMVAAPGRRGGFNRLSIGVQSFDDGLLRLMNRRHDAARARNAVRMAQRAGFDNISIDLIYGIPGMSPAQWERTLDEAIALGVQHISAYHLTIEPGTVFWKMYGENSTDHPGALRHPCTGGELPFQPVTEEVSEKQFGMLREKLGDAGFEHYEISNFALPGRRAVHNSAYWSGEPYLGIGPSAHSFDGERRREWVPADIEKYLAAFGLRTDIAAGFNRRNKDAINTRALAQINDWAKAREDIATCCPSVKTDGNNISRDTIYEGETLSDRELANERVMTGLRTADGIDKLRVTNYELRDRFIKERLLVRNGDRIAIPPEKFLLSDYIIASLFED